jgi:hypothetical protein
MPVDESDDHVVDHLGAARIPATVTDVLKGFDLFRDCEKALKREPVRPFVPRRLELSRIARGEAALYTSDRSEQPAPGVNGGELCFRTQSCFWSADG